ncbi:HCP-like protein [Neocallimastix lanati (nom. inval.)]|jgi:TPR repeat protein|uniref:HCP-like protein n=1 Tax=Neocallimastix californiae TaxID=1754190 RepID=A0A1Y2AFB7_9FUNG|nr:HCP-like protein [Neocallimastix sp. JGI-2020a]ORY21261.1 HCP-like protein [Neocallimastix californiae]|eukprot:ORY21261.1 HCP-like protein [Neocallimastix californiae]
MVRKVNPEKVFKKKALSIKNPHERCKFLVKELISLSPSPKNISRRKTIKKLLVSLSGTNCPEAFLYLGKLYYLPIGNYDKAYSAFKNSIKNRYPLAYYEFGYMVENGYSCRKSTEKAVSCYMKAATCGSIDAMYRLGIAYLYRELGLNSIPKGIKYLDKATILGHGEAAYKLSYIYEIGIDGHLNKNYYNALHYLQESADLLYIPALDKLGWIYENGKLGTTKDPSKAFDYYMKASYNGYSQSMYSLAGLIMNNVNIDDRLAYDWMLKATKVAEPLNKAFYGMGVFYEYGIGVARNLVAALDWYKKARDKNVPDAERKIKDLEYKINAIRNNNNRIKTFNNGNNLAFTYSNMNNNIINRESMAVSNVTPEYMFSPISMPSPAISVHNDNKNQNVIITKDQLMNMNLGINQDGKVIHINDKNSEQINTEMSQTNNNIYTNFENSTVIMESAKNTEEALKKLSKEVPEKVSININVNSVGQKEFYKPEIYKMNSDGNSESINYGFSIYNANNSGINEEEMVISDDNIKKEKHVVLNIPDGYIMNGNALPVPKRLSSFGINNKDNLFENINSNDNEQTTINNADNIEINEDYYDDGDDDEDNDNDNDNDDEDQFLSAEDDNIDPLSDISFEFKYDPIKLNSDSVENINESSKIKASKSIKTYLSLPKRIESHANPITNGELENKNIGPTSTVSTSVFVDHFKNLGEQIISENDSEDPSSFIDRKESKRVFQEEVKLSDEERIINNNDWVERHPTILSLTIGSSEFNDSKVSQKDENNFKSTELNNTENDNSLIENHENINQCHLSSSPLVQSSVIPKSQKSLNGYELNYTDQLVVLPSKAPLPPPRQTLKKNNN